jgi:hypothetical protein
MQDPLDVEQQDPVLGDEIRMVTHLMVVAAQAPGELDQEAIDIALGVEPRLRLPVQRRSRG